MIMVIKLCKLFEIKIAKVYKLKVIFIALQCCTELHLKSSLLLLNSIRYATTKRNAVSLVHCSFLCLFCSDLEEFLL